MGSFICQQKHKTERYCSTYILLPFLTKPLSKYLRSKVKQETIQNSTWLPLATSLSILLSQNAYLKLTIVLMTVTQPFYRALLASLLLDVHVISLPFVGCLPDETADIFSTSPRQLTRGIPSTKSVVSVRRWRPHRLRYDSV